jgi:hypothetical protein
MSGAECPEQGQHRKVAGFDDDPFFDLAHGRHRHLCPRRELFLA